jgi:aconitate hydratase
VTADPLLGHLGRHGEDVPYVSLAALDEDALKGAPMTTRLLVESALRTAITTDGDQPPDHDAASAIARSIVASCARRAAPCELTLAPTRLLLQDHSGLPVLADLASLRRLADSHGIDPEQASPQVPVDLVVDHSVEAFAAGTTDALAANLSRELSLNGERYRFLKWAQTSLSGVRVVPPGSGIVHQVHLEHLARVVMQDRSGFLAPDLVLGTDSHTPMINGLGVLGWGIGGIEAEMAMLGAPVSLLAPRVIGVELCGRLGRTATATDLALTLTEFLRGHDAVGAFVEFGGEGVSELGVPHRATVANMAPEYGCTVAFFPVDDRTVEYLALTGRSDDQIDLVASYLKRQGLFGTADMSAHAEHFCEVWEFDLSSVRPAVAAPPRPQSRVGLAEVPDAFRALDSGPSPEGDGSIPAGAVGIAAITSCTNTSNPETMVLAGLLARNAVRRGMQVPSWVKTSLAPGSRAVPRYLAAAGVMEPLEQLGFAVVGFGCTTCIGNSGPLKPEAAAAIDTGAKVVAVLSGNRNFDGRIHPDIAGSFLASPPLVIAYALAGTVLRDLENDPIGVDLAGEPVMLRELWPDPSDVAAALSHVTAERFAEARRDPPASFKSWQAIPAPTGPLYDWPAESSYLTPSPFFSNGGAPGMADLVDARVLVLAGDGVTTDHISPAGVINRDSAAAAYLRSLGVAEADFNSYGARRCNHEVLVRGVFANRSFRNKVRASVSVFDAAMEHRKDETPLVIIAGERYGTGSSRDWAAKGPALIGVRAVLAKSFERIHRQNLVSVGIVPLEFEAGDGPEELGLTGDELIQVEGLSALREPLGHAVVTATGPDGRRTTWRMRVRADTTRELSYLQAGGALRVLTDQLTQQAA